MNLSIIKVLGYRLYEIFFSNHLTKRYNDYFPYAFILHTGGKPARQRSGVGDTSNPEAPDRGTISFRAYRGS
jgi:hypothetical protein